jgi:FkbH-like protein
VFEFDLYERRLHAAPPATPAGSPPERLAVDKVSLLIWGEHCIECAAPDCFSSCDLYQARPDRRCRRFEFGIYPNKRFRGARGPGAEVRFKQWGKLETRGNARLASERLVHLLERMLLVLTPLVHVVGRLVGKATRDIRFHYASFALLERLLWRLDRGRSATPDAFLVEIYNPMPRPVAAQLTFAVNRAMLSPTVRLTDIPLSHTRRLEIPQGYFRAIIPITEMRRVVASGLRFGVAFTPEAENVDLVFLTLDFVRFKDRRVVESLSTQKPTERTAPSTSHKQAIKCIVFDLDNTLWHGTLLETDEVRLRDGIADLLKRLDSRGILLGIASKNAFDHAWARIREWGLDEYFLSPKINWSPKSENIKAIAADLNIGLDTFAFVDDNPFERSEVSAALPMVTCLDVTELDAFVGSPRCAGSDSDEARNRRRSYQQEAQRTQQLATFGDDYIGFLRACQLVVTIRAFEERDFGRVAELVQRTNQLNFSGHKYSRDEIRAIVDDPARAKFVVSCSDRFGSYGNVGFCIARFAPGRVVVEDFMLSCRVQGKLVEQAVFAHLASRHPEGRPRYVEVRYRETDRNKPARQVLEALRFSAEAGGARALDLATHSLDCDFIEIRDRESRTPETAATVAHE